VAARVRETWEKGTGDRDRIGGVTIGLNPKAELGFLQDELVRGAVTIAIGANEGLGGANKPGFYHAQTLGEATVELDGDVVVRNGRLTF
jgi:leucyl aminopeptidase (aminopeptidase T)